MRRMARNALWVIPLVLAGCAEANSKQLPPQLNDTTLVLEGDTVVVFGGIQPLPRQMRTYRVTMEFDPKTRRFDYFDEPRARNPRVTVYASPGDLILWRSDQGPWAVHHGPLTPFRVIHIHADSGRWAGAQVRADATFGKYRYFVAVEINGRIWMDDPDDMVGPEQ